MRVTIARNQANLSLRPTVNSVAVCLFVCFYSASSTSTIQKIKQHIKLHEENIHCHSKNGKTLVTKTVENTRITH
jgi:hypothetical protein